MSPSSTVLTQSTNSHTTSNTSQQIQEPKKQQRPAQHKPTVKELAPTKRSPPQIKPSAPQAQVKKVSRRSSKPIINWFQRKLAGTVRNTRRVSDGAHSAARPEGDVGRGANRNGGPRTARVASSPFPQPAPSSPPRNISNGRNRVDVTRRTISLNGDDAIDNFDPRTEDEDDMDRSIIGSSLAPESMWSPASALEADDDASVRPLPPSAPPSPSPSRSSSSYLSDPRTFRSMAASTKPTTLLSVDLTPAGVAHIAQVPTTPVSPAQAPRFPAHVRTSSTGTTAGLLGSGASITFSALPPSPQSSRPSSPRNPASINSNNPGAPQTPPATNSHMSSVQAPLHTAHHPRNNPRPSSPPLDNASVLTLASSAFAIPGTRMGVSSIGWGGSATPSAMGGGDSVSHFGGSLVGGAEGEGDSTSQFVLGDDERLEGDAEGERDAGASLRALRPRSSRRGSWGSEASGWSAGVGATGTGASFVRERSLWTTNSFKTGGQLDNDEEEGGSSQDISHDGAVEGSEAPGALETPASSVIAEGDIDARSVEKKSSSKLSGVETTPKKEKSAGDRLGAPPAEARPNSMESATTHTPETNQMLTTEPASDVDLMSANLAFESVHEYKESRDTEGDGHSVAASNMTDNQTDVWHSAPSTPMMY